MNKNDKFLIVSLILIIFFSGPILTFFIDNKITFKFIDKANKNVWIGFYGSIIGGALTLIGVWWTIVNQEKSRKTDLKIEYRPIILINDENYSYNEIYDFLTFNLNLVNVGRGEATNIHINIEENNPALWLIYKKEMNILVKSAKVNFPLSLQVNPISNNDEKLKNYLDYSVVRYIEYDDFGYTDDFPLKEYIFHISITYEDFNQNKYETKIIITANRNPLPILQSNDKDHKWVCTFDKVEFFEK